MTDISLDRTFSITRNAFARDLEGEAVVLDLESGTYFGLNCVGTRIWHLIEDNGHLRVVFDTLCREYDAAPADIERDLLALVARLAEAGLGELA
jgi:hypothetical protein